MRYPVYCLFILIGSFCSFPAFADDMKMSSAEMDQRLNVIIYDTVTLGTDLYNHGNQEGCHRLYQGALMSIIPMLESRPALKKQLMDKFERAKAMPAISEKAFAMRELLDMVRQEVKPKRALWDRLGGEPAVKAVIHDFVLAAAPDPKVNFFRNGQFKLDAAGVEKLERLLVELVSAVTGGPLKYTGRDMKSTHAGMKITDAEFDALAGHLVATLKKYKVPDAELMELVNIVASTRKDIVEMPKKPLWDRFGGEAGVRAVTREFLITAAKDPKANIDRNGNYPLTKERVARVEQLVVEQISSVTGGPLKYTGRDMKNSHQGMMITEAEFNVSAGYLIAALKKYNVPQAEIDELVGLVSTLKDQIVEKK
ncbi:MAG: group 1 truncated hemoglobin [Gemmatales bacterium]